MLNKNNIALGWSQIGLSATIIMAGCIYLSLLTTYLVPLDGFWSGDQGVKIIQVQSMLRSKYATNALIYPGEVFDPQHEFSPLRGQYMQQNGQSLSMFSAAFAFVSSIPFFLWGYPGLYIVPVLSTLMLLVVCINIGKYLLSPFWLIAASLTLGLASPFFFYSVVFWEHTLAALLTTLSLWWAVVCVRHQWGRLILVSGVLISAATWFRNETILCLMSLGVALFILGSPRRWSYVWWLGVGAIIGVAPLLAFNTWVYGNPVGPHVLIAGGTNYRDSMNIYSFFNARLSWADLLILPFSYTILPLMIILFGATIARTRLKDHYLAWIDIVISFFIFLLGAYVLTQIKNGLQTTLLLTFPPVLLCFLPEASLHKGAALDATQPSPVANISAEQLSRLLLAFATVYIGLAWLLQIPDGGTQWGPRMLLPAIPALALAGFWRISTWYNRSHTLLFRGFLTITVVTLIGASLVCEIYGIRQIHDSNTDTHLVTAVVDQSQQQVIITDIWYVPTVIAPLFYDGHLIYLVDSGAKLDSLLKRVSDKGITTFYYMGARSKTVAKDSQSWSRLVAVGKPQKLPFGLTGAVYRISP